MIDGERWVKYRIAKSWLIDKYVNKQLSLEGVSRLIPCSPATIQRRLQHFGIPRRKNYFKNGPQNPSWNGGRSEMKGYIRIKKPDHPNADPNGYVFEHRYVMEQHIGRLLKPFPQEVVHHIDGQKDNNDISNLTLTTNTTHQTSYSSAYQDGYTKGYEDALQLNNGGNNEIT